MLRVRLVAQRRELLDIAAGDVLHQKRVGDAAEGDGGNHDHLAMARRNRQRHVHGIGMPHAAVEADEQPPLRLGKRRVFGPVSKELDERTRPLETTNRSKRADKRGDIAFLDPAVFDFAAAVAESLSSAAANRTR